MARKITINADQLRQLAEEADAKRGKKLKMVATNDQTRPVRFVEVSAAGGKEGQAEEEVCIEVETPGAGAKQLKVILPDVVFKNAKGELLEGKPGSPGKKDDYSVLFDCIYWSASAIEKFVVPYYSSFVKLQDIQDKIIKEFEDPTTLAFGHLPDSEVVEGGDGGGMQSFGLVKLSRETSSKELITVQPVIFR